MQSYVERMENLRILPRKEFAIMKLYVDTENPELVALYEANVEKHNQAMFTDVYANSGFDLFVPEETIFKNAIQTQMISMKVKTEMTYCNISMNTQSPSAFYLYPRSSMSKKPLMLANHVGIIDSGYRGWIIGAFRWLKIPELPDYSTYVVEKHTQLVQICHPSLCPIFVELVKDEESLSTTLRGSGGFGSTG
jgi:dUTP pyrophosphatase